MKTEQPQGVALIVSRQRMIAEMLIDYLAAHSAITASWVPDLEQVDSSRDVGLVVLDLDPLPKTGFTEIAEAKAKLDCPVAILTEGQDTDLFLRLVNAGAAGILQKQKPLRSVVATLLLLIAGERYVPVGL